MLCPNCGKRRPSVLHHGIISRKKGYTILDREENLIPTCFECNDSREMDTYDSKQRWWRVQVERLGLDVMNEWLILVNLQFTFPPFIPK